MKRPIDEIRNIGGITSEDFALALAEEYNLDVVLLKEKGRPYLTKAVPVVYVSGVPGIRMVLLDLEGKQGVGNLGIYTGSRTVKKQGLRNELERQGIRVNEGRLNRVKEAVRGYGVYILGTVDGEPGMYKLKESVKGEYKTESGKRIETVRDVMIG